MPASASSLRIAPIPDVRFRTGDIVRLRSGGPRMTVVAIEIGPEGENLYRCVWFANELHRSTVFPENALEAPEP